MFRALLLHIGTFAAPLRGVHLLYIVPTTMGCRESHVDHFDPNG